MKKRLICLVLALALMGTMGVLPALAEAAAAPEPITFTFFDKNTGDAFDNPVAKEITKRTGVTLEIMQPSADPTEKLGLMLASGDLADFMLLDRSSDLVNKYISARAVIALDDLIAEHGPNIQAQYGEVINKSRYSDGKTYYLNNWYGTDPDPVYGWMVRRDWLVEIIGEEEAMKTDGFTLTEMYDILAKFKELGKVVDDKPTIAMSWNGNNNDYINTLFAAQGGYPYYVDGDKLMYQARDPKFKEALMLGNKIYTNGLLDVDWVSYKDDTFKSKMSSGTVFSTLCPYWGVNDMNAVLRDVNDSLEAQFYGYKIYADDLDPAKTTLGGRSTLGWDAICISRVCKDPVRAIQFADYLASEEGQTLLMWGVEGEHWNRVDGKMVPAEGLLDRFKTDWTLSAKETGVRKWTYFIKNGYMADGTVYDLVGKFDRIPTERWADQTLSDTHYDNDEFNNLNPEGGTDLAMIYQRIEDIMKVARPKVVVAASADEAAAVFDQMIKDMDAAGAAKVEEYMSKKYFDRLGLWGITSVLAR